jgi:general secretion pathway protein G
MIVLFIILSIAAAALLNYSIYIDNSRKQTTQQYVTNLSTAIQSFNLTVGRYPSTLQDLLDCPSDVSTSKWGGPFVTSLQADPWQNEYRYITPGQRVKDFDVWSAGPDGQDGNEDDIGNWPKSK